MKIVEVTKASVGDASAYREVAGFVTLTPTNASMNGGASLRVPYYLVPRVRSNLSSDFVGKAAGPSRPSATPAPAPSGTRNPGRRGR